MERSCAPDRKDCLIPLQSAQVVALLLFGFLNFVSLSNIPARDRRSGKKAEIYSNTAKGRSSASGLGFF